MDCGPASLKCLLEGLGVRASYGRLREACQADVDGTSIDTLEEVAGRLGLDAQQVMLPVDHVLLPETQALPCLAVTRLPGDFTHFVVIWRRHGGFVQVMDPAVGRRFVRAGDLTRDLYRHTFPVPAAAWRAWAASDEVVGPLKRRWRALGVTEPVGERLLARALEHPGWESLAALDAATRMVAALAAGGGLRPGPGAEAALEHWLDRRRTAPPDADVAVPDGYWSVRPAPPGADGEPRLFLRGAVLIRVRGRRPADLAALPEDLAAVLRDESPRPGRELARLCRKDGLLAPLLVLAGLALAVTGAFAEAVLLRAWLNGAGVLAALLGLGAALTGVEWALAGGTAAMGRRLEARLRTALLAAIPRLPDHYIRTRPTSDLAERSHNVYLVRVLPDLAAEGVRAALEFGLVTAGLVWLDPGSAPLALGAAVVAVGLALASQPSLAERDLRLRSHTGAMARFYLDALLGLVAIRAHGAEDAVRREHEGLLGAWLGAGRAAYRAIVTVEGLQALTGFGLAAWIVARHQGQATGPGDLLLLMFWALGLPVLAHRLSLVARQYPVLRSITLRFLEPLGAPGGADGTVESPAGSPAGATGDGRRGSRVAFERLSVRRAGRVVLEDVDLEIPAGGHVAVVGASGAGKSTLVGVLLGWYRPAAGRVLVGDEPCEGAGLERLREATAWVDPAVQLWNRTLDENLLYGAAPAAARDLPRVIEAAELAPVIARLPEGLATRLGENGGLLSGGEGQRVRLARALLRREARLVVLDEPFRGLDREQRSRLLATARRWWADATLLCVTHDIEDTLGFDRVLVVETGRVVEDGAPAVLRERPGSRYRAALDGARAVRETLWGTRHWRRLEMDAGRLHETPPEPRQ